MIYKNIELTPYRKYLTRPLSNSSNKYTQSKGYMIKFYIENKCGCGEVVILNSFSKTTGKEVEWAFEELKLSLTVGDNYTKNDLLNLFTVYANKIPELHFGLDTALYDVLSSLQSIALSNYLNPDCRDVVKFSSIYQEDTILSNDRVKVKLGFGFNKDIDKLLKVSSQSKKSTLYRLDFNGAYSTKEAIKICKELSEYNIEYIEEPFRDIDENKICNFKNEISIPIAIDETLIKTQSQDLIKKKIIEYVVLKPSLFGSFRDIFKLYELTKAKGVKLILSSSLERIVGNLSCIHLAAAMNIEGPHGLNNKMFYDFETINFYYDSYQVIIKDLQGLGVCWNDN
tara:strand:+ start:205 stop:1227 length:1023 start_codon:yes stop_codon:yes gene_type:complete